MNDNDILARAANEYERLLKIAEEKNYKRGWVYYKLKEKFGARVASQIYEPDYSIYSDGDGWDGDVSD